MAESDAFLVLNSGNNEDDGVADMEDKENMGDNVPMLVRLTESAFSGATFERKAAACQIQDVFAQAYFMEEPLANLIVIIERLVEDDEQVVRAEVTDQLWKIGVFCQEIGDPLDYVLVQHVLPYSVRLLSDEISQVRKLSQAGILRLLEKGILTLSHIQEHVYPVLLQLSEHPESDEHRSEAASFMGKLALMVGKETTVNFYLERFCQLCEDPLFPVRRVCAASMGDFARIVGTYLTQEVLLPKFLALCGDDAWSVRKGCAEVFTFVSSNCELSIRKETLSPSFIKLLEDPSRWVRMAAYESLGSLIATYSRSNGDGPKIELSPLEEAFIQRLKTNGEQVRLEGKFQKMVEDCISRPDKSTVIDIPDVNGNSAAPTVSNDGSGDSKIDSPEVTTKLATATNKQDSPGDGYFRDVDKSFCQDDLSFEEMNCDSDSKELPVITELIKKCEDPMTQSTSSSDKSEMSNIKLPQRDSENNVPLTKSDPNSNFNTWQYWRLPVNNLALELDLPDFEIELCLAEPPANNNSNPSDSSTSAASQNPFDNTSPSLSQVDAVNANFQSTNADCMDDQQKPEGDGVPDKLTVEDCFEKMTRERKGSGGFNTKRKTNAKSETLDASGVDIWGEFAEPGQAMEALEISSSNASPFSEESSSDAQEKFESMYNDFSQWREDKHSSESSLEEATNHVPGDVHRSYMNLFKPYTDEGNYYNEMGSMFEPDDLPYILRAHGPKGNSKLLPNIPEPASEIAQNIVPDGLLKHFVEMCSPTRDLTLESELASVCVFSLPAVVHTLGSENWPRVRNCFENLALRYQWKIRYTLAASLHEIAAVLGPDLSARDLLPFYAAMTKDMDEVRIGVLRNLASFVNVLHANDRKLCLESFKSFLSIDNKRNWRFKAELADQLSQMAGLYEVEDIMKYIFPIAFELILESISAVRQAGMELVCLLLSKLKGLPSFSKTQQEKQLQSIRDFISQLVTLLCYSKRWTHRQLFAKLARQLLVSNAVTISCFADHILPHLIALSDDQIPNVRLVVAQALSEIEKHFSPLDPHYEVVMSSISMLQCDPDRDVQYYSGGNVPEKESVEEKESPQETAPTS